MNNKQRFLSLVTSGSTQQTKYRNLVRSLKLHPMKLFLYKNKEIVCVTEPYDDTQALTVQDGGLVVISLLKPITIQTITVDGNKNVMCDNQYPAHISMIQPMVDRGWLELEYIEADMFIYKVI